MNRYMVGRVLGEGGFGITYIGCDLRLEMKVAIKEYFPTDKVTRNSTASLDVTNYIGAASAGYDEGKVRFLNEARTMARMDKQPEIVCVRDFFEDHNTAYIVMEYINGTTFKELVSQRGGRIPAEELLPMMEPLFSALTAMHRLGLIHRDISPDNLMLEKGALRLLDFGCARESARGTETMTIALKHGYAPIEQYQHKGQGPWTDVYALSATIYYCLTGKTPPQSLDRLCEDELILPRKLGVNITERQEKALLYGMGIRPRKRFQSVEELHAALYIPGGAPIPDPDDGETPISLISDHVPVNTDDVPIGTVISPDSISHTTPSTFTEEHSPSVNTEEQNTFGDETPNLFSFLKKHSLAAAMGTVVILTVVLCIIFLPGNEDTPDTPDNPGVTVPSDDSGSPTGNEGGDSAGGEENANPFENAVYFNTGSEQEFRAMMADDSVSAVILNSYLLLSGEELVITKPLRINHGCGLNSYSPITITDGGYLHMEGEMCCDALLRAAGGSLHIASTGRLVGNGFLWLTHDEDVTCEEGSFVDLCGRPLSSEDRRCFLTADEGSIFANAAHVSTFEDLLSANGDYAVSAIVIDGDLSIDRSFTSQKPVLIREGVTVTGEMSPNHDFSIVPTWCVDGTLLFNRGTVTGSMNFGQWSGQSPAVINYGTMNVTLHVDCSGCLINYGELVSSDTHCPSGTFINMGRTVHARDELSYDAFMDFADRLLNHGEILISGNDGRITCAGEGPFLNSGTITVENHSGLQVECYFLNSGSIHVMPTARLDGSGYIEQITAKASLIVEMDATFPFCGLLTYNKDSTVRIIPPANFVHIPFDWCNGGPDWDAKVHHVYNEAELNQALEDPACQVVAIDCDLELHGDRVFPKNICVPGSITVHDGSLTLTNGAYMISGDTRVESGNLIVEDGAVWLNRSQLKCNELIVRNGSSFFNNGWMNEVGRLELSHSNFTNVCGSADLTGSALEVTHGRFLSLSLLYLHDCDIIVGEGGELSSFHGYFSIDSGTRIENHGRIAFYAWEWQEQMLDVAMENYGTLHVADGARIYGAIDNYGTIEVNGFIPVNGTVKNHGEIVNYYGNLYAVDGEITGNAPVNP